MLLQVARISEAAIIHQRTRASNLERINSDFVKIYTLLMKLILPSPFHSLFSKNIMLITFTGRKSGKVYTTPVVYVHNGDDIIIFSQSHSTWWRNLRGGAPVTVRVKGQDLKAIGESIEDPKAVVQGLMVYLQKLPQYAKYFLVSLDPDRQPNPDDVARAAQNRVMIRIQLAQGRVGQ